MLRVVTPPDAPPAALVVADILAVLDGAAAGDTSRVTQLIVDATLEAENISTRSLWRREYEALIEGDGESTLYLPVKPVVAVTSVTVDGTTETVAEGTGDDDFEIWTEPGILFRRSGWPTECYRIIFNAGYWLPSMGATPPGAPDVAVEGSALRSAVEAIVRHSWAVSRTDANLRAERVGGLGGFSFEYAVDIAVPPKAERVLEQLRPIVP